MKTCISLLVFGCSLLADNSFRVQPTDDWFQQVDLANQQVERGDFDGAAAAYKTALNDAETAGDNERAGVVLQNLGRLFDRQGRLRDAERTYLQAIAAFERAGPIDGRLLVRAAAGLSAVYLQTEQYSRAETLIARMLNAHPAAAGSDNVTLICNLAVVHAHRGEFREAERMLRKAADLCSETADPEMLEAGSIAVANLAELQMRARRTDDAIASYRQALTIMEAVPHPAPATFASTLAGYARAAQSRGDPTVASDAYLRSIAIAEARLGPNHVVLAQLLWGYAEVARATGRKLEARRMVDAARRIQERWDRENLTGHTIDLKALRNKGTGRAVQE